VRTRIALTTAMAVIMSISVLLVALFTSTPAASIGAIRHEAVDLHHGSTPHRAVRINDKAIKVMSYAQAHKVAQMVAFANAVEAQKLATFYQGITYLEAVAAQQKAAAAQQTMPAAWMPTAICEEGGRNDPNYGYFGIKEWNGFGGYPTAGSAPLSVQLAWEAKYIGAPPDAPGQCHSY